LAFGLISLSSLHAGRPISVFLPSSQLSFTMDFWTQSFYLSEQVAYRLNSTCCLFPQLSESEDISPSWRIALHLGRCRYSYVAQTVLSATLIWPLINCMLALWHRPAVSVGLAP